MSINNSSNNNNNNKNSIDEVEVEGANILPPLPDLKSPTLHEVMGGPASFCNWVIPGRLLAGENLAIQEESEVVRLVKTVGLRCYVNLCEEQEISSEKRAKIEAIIDSHPSPCPFYAIHFPILDGECPTNKESLEIMINQLMYYMKNNPKSVVYICCWAGRGRTGIIASILLGKMYSIDGPESLQRINKYYKTRKISISESPEYYHQRIYVLDVLGRKS